MADERPLSSMLGTEVLHDVMDVMLRIPERPLPMAIEDLTAGKTPLAQAITAKGVQASKDDSIRALAEKVGQIQQEIFNVEETKIGELIFPNESVFNIIAEGYSHVRGDYSTLVCCEFYKGYDTIPLSGADAYYTCDGDFYTAATTHTWHDEELNKLNRYVIYYYSQNEQNFNIADESICPRRMFIKGHLGKIVCNISGRIQNIYVDGILNDFSLNYQPLENNLFIQNMGEHLSGDMFPYSASMGIVNMNLGITKLSGNVFGSSAYKSFNSLVSLSFDRLESIMNGAIIYETSTESEGNWYRGLTYVSLKSLQELDNGFVFKANQYGSAINKLQTIYMPSLTTIKNSGAISQRPNGGHDFDSLIDVEVGEMVTNLNIRWNPTAVIADPTKLATLNANIRNHIAAKVSDRTGQSALTFTVSTNLYNNLEQATKDAFTAKNWNVVGA